MSLCRRPPLDKTRKANCKNRQLHLFDFNGGISKWAWKFSGAGTLDQTHHFEPLEERVCGCSWCPGRDSNSHSLYRPVDFKSTAYAIPPPGQSTCPTLLAATRMTSKMTGGGYCGSVYFQDPISNLRRTAPSFRSQTSVLHHHACHPAIPGILHNSQINASHYQSRCIRCATNCETERLPLYLAAFLPILPPPECPHPRLSASSHPIPRLVKPPCVHSRRKPDGECGQCHAGEQINHEMHPQILRRYQQAKDTR